MCHSLVHVKNLTSVYGYRSLVNRDRIRMEYNSYLLATFNLSRFGFLSSGFSISNLLSGRLHQAPCLKSTNFFQLNLGLVNHLHIFCASMVWKNMWYAHLVDKSGQPTKKVLSNNPDIRLLVSQFGDYVASSWRMCLASLLHCKF